MSFKLPNLGLPSFWPHGDARKSDLGNLHISNLHFHTYRIILEPTVFNTFQYVVSLSGRLHIEISSSVPLVLHGPLLILSL